ALFLLIPAKHAVHLLSLHDALPILEPMRRFAFNWRPHAVEPDRDYSNEPHTLVEFTLEPTATGTRLVVVESGFDAIPADRRQARSEEHTSELQSRENLVCRLLLDKK